MMRIGVVSGGLPPHVGGGFTFEQEVLGQFLLAAPSSAHWFTLIGASPADPASLPENVVAVPAPGWRMRLRARIARAALDVLAARFDLDVFWHLIPLHEVTDTPYVTVVWDLQHRLQPLFPEVSARGVWAAREADASIRLRRAAAVVTGTEEGRREISRFYGVAEDRIHVIPHPTPGFALDAPASPPDTLSRFGLDPGYVLYPAQFWPHKNHINLLLALALLKQQGLELPLVMVGSNQGNVAHVSRAVEELGLSRQVRLLGFVPTDDLVALYRGALCLAYVSLFGPENLPPLEAFALGCPVIASDVAGAREQLADAALLVDATRPQSIAEALLRVHAEPDLRERLVAAGTVRARRWVGSDFAAASLALLDRLEPYVRCWKACWRGSRA